MHVFIDSFIYLLYSRIPRYFLLMLQMLRMSDVCLAGAREEGRSAAESNAQWKEGLQTFTCLQGLFYGQDQLFGFFTVFISQVLQLTKLYQQYAEKIKKLKNEKVKI